MEEKIMTLHPQGKAGVNISKAKYNTIKETILDILKHEQEITFKELGNRVKARLTGSFEGSITWYLVTVKQDLEARGILQLPSGKSPQIVKLMPE